MQKGKYGPSGVEKANLGKKKNYATETPILWFGKDGTWGEVSRGKKLKWGKNRRVSRV